MNIAHFGSAWYCRGRRRKEIEMPKDTVGEILPDSDGRLGGHVVWIKCHVGGHDVEFAVFSEDVISGGTSGSKLKEGGLVIDARLLDPIVPRPTVVIPRKIEIRILRKVGLGE